MPKMPEEGEVGGGVADWHLKFPFSALKSNPTCLIHQSTIAPKWWSGRGGGGGVVRFPLWENAAKNIKTLSHISIANLFANGFQGAE